MKYSPKEFEKTLKQQIDSLVDRQIKLFSDPVIPTIEEIEIAAEEITTELAKLTGISMKKLISRFLWLYYTNIK